MSNASPGKQAPFLNVVILKFHGAHVTSASGHRHRLASGDFTAGCQAQRALGVLVVSFT